MVTKFNNNTTSKAFLLSTRAGCLGISLVAANRLFLFDASFNPSDDLQAIGRIFRYGQVNPTYIYKFVMDDSLERAIFNHQIRKQQISKRTIDSENSPAYMSLRIAMASYFANQKVEIKSATYNGSDYVLNNVFTNFPNIFNAEPILHESLLINSNNDNLSLEEMKLAMEDYNSCFAI